MHTEGDEVHIDAEDASAGANDGNAHVRWILAIGTILAIVALSIIWMTGAFTQGDIEEEATASGRISSQEDGDANDSIVTEDFDEVDGSGASDSELATIENE